MSCRGTGCKLQHGPALKIHQIFIFHCNQRFVMTRGTGHRKFPSLQSFWMLADSWFHCFSQFEDGFCDDPYHDSSEIVSPLHHQLSDRFWLEALSHYWDL